MSSFIRSIVVLLLFAGSHAPVASFAQQGNEKGLPPGPVADRQLLKAGGNAIGVPPEPADTMEESMEVEPAAAVPIVIRDYVVVPSVGRYGRIPFHQDAVEAQWIRGKFVPPTPGDSVDLPDGKSRPWRSARAGDEGWLADQSLRGGYAFATVESQEDRVALLHARGHSMVYAGGEPRTGDPYNLGFVRIPVRLRKGKNQFLFHVGSGRLRAELSRPAGPVLLDLADATLPDLIAGETTPKWAAVVVINATDRRLVGVSISCSREGSTPVTTPVSAIAPLSIFKVPFQIDGTVREDEREVVYTLRLVSEAVPSATDSPADDRADAARSLNENSIKLRVAGATELHQRTFVSEIDGSVQSYSVRPGVPRAQGKYGILLALHGAGVEAKKHAAQYTAKEWAHVVAPTNRRPFGFDWEDWGRLDALEVLADAEKLYGTDRRRVYLTGHSMGGHGTWHLGVNFPGRFAAIGPSAGWVNFWSYDGVPKIENPNAMEKMLIRGSVPSDTAVLTANLAALGVFVLHGQQDKIVPVAQSRFMRGQLGRFHTDFVYHEQPGAKHWWGRQCCDWPPMMQFLKNHRLPDASDVHRVNFITATPGVSSRMHWAAIEMQEKPLLPSRVLIDFDSKNRIFRGKTNNVTRLAVDVAHLKPGPIGVELDGQKRIVLQWPRKKQMIWLTRRRGEWRATRQPSKHLKGPHRYGTFKDVFRHRAVLVFGTAGTPEENAWSFAKARFDAETFWYRGNGTLQVVSDTAFESKKMKDRNVVLYGNTTTNAAWPKLLSTSEIRVRNEIGIGDRREQSDDLACLFVLPRHDSDVASVGVVSGTSLTGMRLTNRLRYFVSGVAYPDLAVFDPGVLSDGTSAIRALGYFGEDWKLESGDFVWRDVAL